MSSNDKTTNILQWHTMPSKERDRFIDLIVRNMRERKLWREVLQKKREAQMAEYIAKFHTYTHEDVPPYTTHVEIALEVVKLLSDGPYGARYRIEFENGKIAVSLGLDRDATYSNRFLTNINRIGTSLPELICLTILEAVGFEIVTDPA